MITIFHPSDPACKSKELWHFVYLDGLAESHNEITAIKNGWDWQAPDLCCINEDQRTLAKGEHECILYGKPAIAFLSKRGGRVVLKEETPDRIAFNRELIMSGKRT